MFFDAEIPQKPPKLWVFLDFIPPTHIILPTNGTHLTPNLTRNLIKYFSVQKNVVRCRYFPKTVKNWPKMTQILTSPQPTT